MNVSNSSSLQVSSTDSGFINNSLPSNPSQSNIYSNLLDFQTINNNLIIFLVMLAMVSYLMNRMPRLNRTQLANPSKSSIKK